MEIISPPHMPTGLPPLKDEPKPLLFGRNYSILVFIISVFASHTIHTRLQLQLFEKQQLHAKLSLLQAQINPHFLFNTLNSIYALVIQKDDKAADAIVHLSEMMRYTLHNSNANEIDLQTEVNYVKNYIALQQARLGNTVVVQEEIAGDFTGRKIAPLLLITFIENAFKHGVNPNKPSVISIAINDQLPGLNLFVSNQKVNSPQDENGIGLKNIQSRLQLLYADRYSLHIDDTATQYAVTLTIDLL